MTYQIIHGIIHELESELSNLANTTRKGKVKEAVEYALDSLRNQVTEWVRTAENRCEKAEKIQDEQ